MLIQENISAKEYSTFGIGGSIRYAASARTINELEEALAYAQKHAVPLIVIGEGSNSIWSDRDHAVFVLRLDMRDIAVISEDTESVMWEIGAGMHWDTLVERAIEQSLSGIECMSGIPGSVGAAPVQNIGAYGQEICDMLVSVRAYDTQEKKITTLSNAECQFSYRNSIFKSTQKGRYIIVAVRIRLLKKRPHKAHYESLETYLNEHRIIHPSLSDIRRAVLAIRSTKLPDPKLIPNCGSFFENPIISRDKAMVLKEQYPDIKIFEIDNLDYVKIPAGWLIEKAGLRGKDFGNISVYKNNALVLVNKGNAPYADLCNVRDEIITTIEKFFMISLNPEANIFE